MTEEIRAVVVTYDEEPTITLHPAEGSARRFIPVPGDMAERWEAAAVQWHAAQRELKSYLVSLHTTHEPRPGHSYDPLHRHEWANGCCQKPDCLAVLPPEE